MSLQFFCLKISENLWTSIHDNPLPGGAVDPTVYDDVVGRDSPAHKRQWCRLSQGHTRPWPHGGRGQEEIHWQTEGGQEQELVDQCQLGPAQHGPLRQETQNGRLKQQCIFKEALIFLLLMLISTLIEYSQQDKI